MRDHVDRRVRTGVGADSLVREAFRILVGANAVDRSTKQQILRVGTVTGQEDCVIVVFDKYAELARTVAWEGNEGYVARLGEAQALREAPERLRLEVDRGRVKPGWPAPVRVTTQLALQAGCVCDLGARDKDFRIREVVQAASVVGVQSVITARRTSPGSIPSRSSCGPISCSGSTNSRTASRKTGCQRGK